MQKTPKNKQQCSYYLADGHCDTATATTAQELAYGSKTSHLDFVRLCQNSSLQVFAFFVKNQGTVEEQRDFLTEAIKSFYQALSLTPFVEIFKTARQLSRSNNLLAILALEGADLIQNELLYVEYLYNLGFRSMGLFWNNDNWVGCGANSNLLGNVDKGLTAEGCDFIEYLEANNWLIDLAHSSRESFWQVSRLAKNPFFVSHACCDGLVANKRNLTDGQLKAIGQAGGMVGITFVNQFLRAAEAGVSTITATIEDVVDHLCYGINQAGIDSVGLGSDFDGTDSLPLGINGIEGFEKIAQALAKRGFGSNEICKVMGLNWRRFFQENLPKG